VLGGDAVGDAGAVAGGAAGDAPLAIAGGVAGTSGPPSGSGSNDSGSRGFGAATTPPRGAQTATAGGHSLTIRHGSHGDGQQQVVPPNAATPEQAANTVDAAKVLA
jgi:hypothetical protein